MTVADEHARAVTEPDKTSSTVTGPSTGPVRWERTAPPGLLALMGVGSGALVYSTVRLRRVGKPMAGLVSAVA